MGSYQGHRGFPFGYNPDVIHGVGLPKFTTPGPPPGQPLLNDHETQDLNSFFGHFESNDFGQSNKNHLATENQGEKTMHQLWDMPPTFVGSETSLRRPHTSSIDPHHLQMGEMMYNEGMLGADMSMIPTNAPFDHTLHQTPAGMVDSYPSAMMNHFQSPHTATPQSYNPNWPPAFEPQPMMPNHPNTRPLVRFGSDSHFQATGYSAPPSQGDADIMQNLGGLGEGLEWDPQSSATNTQPNTQPNTEPSSPIYSRKRKIIDTEDVESSVVPIPLSNGYHRHSISAHEMDALPDSSANGKKRKIALKQEHSPVSVSPIPKTIPKRQSLSRSKRKQPSSSPSPPPAPVMPSRSSRSSKPTAKSTPAPPKLKSRPSTSSAGGRQPLTLDQKKANHTNSEQRRRDATGRAYAELYDLMPEIEGMGKMSTTKKLERVVSKLTELKTGNEVLKRQLGL